MTNRKTGRAAKAVAFVLCVLCLTAALSCVGPLRWLNGQEAGAGYQHYKDRTEALILENRIAPVTDVLCGTDRSVQADTDQWVRARMREIESWTDGDPNLFYTVRGADGRLLLASEELGDYRAKDSQTVTLPEVAQVSETYSSNVERETALERLQEQYDSVSVSDCSVLETDHYTLEAVCINYGSGETISVNGFIRAEMVPYGQTWQQLSQAAALYSARPVYRTVLSAGTVFGLLCLGFLLLTTGHERDVEGIALNGFDYKGPIDLLLPAGLIAVLVWLAAGLDSSGWKLIPDLFPVLPYALLCLAFAFGLYVLLSVARRVKAKEPQKGSLFFAKAGRLCGRGLRWTGRELEALLGKLPLFWQAAAVFLVFTFLEGLSVVAIADGDFPGVFFWFLLKALEAAGIIRLVLSLRELQTGGRELAAGNLDYQVPLDRLRGPFRAHGQDLNSIRDAIQGAVEQRMKSERMKTELITNVSHDIKTPLTSIVSYVDLLKKQEMPTPEAREYLEILDRQSARLKKLTEDLVEASKASTGNLTVSLEPTDVNVLLAQSLGEYQERLRAADLEPVLTPAPASPVILADGRLLWRVFDNLLSNIRKYAQPGTRAYLSCETSGDRAVILFRNISASPLNISAEELMERFVRGDAARSTEGSGLGLSIAQDLTRLQGGTFSLEIDGDLFKARLDFPLAQ